MIKQQHEIFNEKKYDFQQNLKKDLPSLKGDEIFSDRT